LEECERGELFHGGSEGGWVIVGVGVELEWAVGGWDVFEQAGQSDSGGDGDGLDGFFDGIIACFGGEGGWVDVDVGIERKWAVGERIGVELSDSGEGGRGCGVGVGVRGGELQCGVGCGWDVEDVGEHVGTHDEFGEQFGEEVSTVGVSGCGIAGKSGVCVLVVRVSWVVFGGPDAGGQFVDVGV
jgi:hypothetical protein